MYCMYVLMQVLLGARTAMVGDPKVRSSAENTLRDGGGGAGSAAHHFIVEAEEPSTGEKRNGFVLLRT